MAENNFQAKVTFKFYIKCIITIILIFPETEYCETYGILSNNI